MTDYRIMDDLTVQAQELAELIDSLPQWRRQAALRHRHERGRRECCLSYLLLCDMLRDSFGIEAQPRFEVGRHGKPSLLLTDSPVADGVLGQGRAVTFNLSHCRNAIACVVSDTDEVGIDVECTGRYTAALADYSMSEAEKRQIAVADDPDVEFTLLWTKKEALLKLTGEGITDDLKTVLTSPRMEGVELFGGCCKEKGYAWSVAQRRRQP